MQEAKINPAWETASHRFVHFEEGKGLVEGGTMILSSEAINKYNESYAKDYRNQNAQKQALRDGPEDEQKSSSRSALRQTMQGTGKS